MLDEIKKRYSVRTYTDTQIDNVSLTTLSSYLSSIRTGIFGNAVRLKIIDMRTAEKEELRKLGTYGLVKNVSMFIAGVVKIGQHDMEDFGYCMEKAILEATRLGIGTVWLGGFLSRSAFGGKMNIREDEVLPAVTPIGYPEKNRSFKDKMIRTLSNGDNRIGFDKLFFEGDINNPLSQTACGAFFEPLESVRLAPSASNKQPWRIIKEKDKDVFHFFMNEDKVYNNAIKGIRLQNLDMGIAMCHFEMQCGSLGIKGKWVDMSTDVKENNLEYIISWSV